jgi:Amidohydrolase family
MTKTFVLLGAGLGLLVGACRTTAPPGPMPRIVEYTNGLWLTDSGFERRAAWSVGETLTFRMPPRTDATADLGGGFVVPPFGEAHNHNVENAENVDALARKYLEHGIFYVKNPTNFPGVRERLAGKINVPTSIDVTFSNGGLTGSGGHPLDLVRRNVARGSWPVAEEVEGFYWIVDSDADLDRKWPLVMQGRPDFLKTTLIYCEEYAERKDDPKFFGWRGLDPRMLPKIVKRAHRAGLRVSTHVESAADFRAALDAGVDEINHMPGFRMTEDVRPHPDSAFEIPAEAAHIAARNRVVVVTTIGEAGDIDPNGPKASDRARYDALHRRNLRTLHDAGVAIALGSDAYRGDTVAEALYIHRLGVFDNRTLLGLWCGTTARTIFPKRKIGALREGYEASFLVLDGNPLEDFTNVTKIRMRVKQGRAIVLATAAPPNG